MNYYSIKMCVIGLAVSTVTACTSTEVGTTVGGATGAGVGYAVSGGSALGTVIGGGAGALIGNQIGQSQQRTYYRQGRYYYY